MKLKNVPCVISEELLILTIFFDAVQLIFKPLNFDRVTGLKKNVINLQNHEEYQIISKIRYLSNTNSYREKHFCECFILLLYSVFFVYDSCVFTLASLHSTWLTVPYMFTFKKIVIATGFF